MQWLDRKSLVIKVHLENWCERGLVDLFCLQIVSDFLGGISWLSPFNDQVSSKIKRLVLHDYMKWIWAWMDINLPIFHDVKGSFLRQNNMF